MPFDSPELDAWASGFPLTLLHVGVALAILIAGAALYAMVVIAASRDPADPRGHHGRRSLFGGVLVGIALPLAFALAASTSVLEISAGARPRSWCNCALFLGG